MGEVPMKKGGGGTRDKDLGVKIEAQFVVGEYQIVILSAKDSGGLDQWLRINKYKIPEGGGESAPRAAKGLATAPRGAVQLDKVVRSPLPKLGIAGQKPPTHH
jgi:hypothetical protein